MDKPAEFWQLIAALEGAQPVPPNDVQRILTVQWATEDTKANPYFTIRQGQPQGPVRDIVSKVELRTPRQPGKGGLLILTIAPGFDLPDTGPRQRFPHGQGEPASATAPKTQPNYYVVARPWGTLAFAVSRQPPARVVHVVLRTPEPSR